MTMLFCIAESEIKVTYIQYQKKKKKFHGMFVSVQKWRMISKSHGHVTTTLGMLGI